MFIAEIGKASLNPPLSDFIFKSFDLPEEAYAQLKDGLIDILDYQLNFYEVQDALSDPNLEVVEGLEDRMYLFDFNNNYTIPEYPNVKSPLHELKFRRAIAHAINKTYIIEAFWQNMAERIDQPLPAVFFDWMNETYTGVGYPYEYNLTKASQLLDDLGFVDTDGNGYRNYPVDWPGLEGQRPDFTYYPLKVCVRIEHSQRLYTGQYLVSQLQSIGVACNVIYGDASYLFPIVFDDRNYHIYTSGWRITNCFASYYLYHSEFWYPNGHNYVTGMNESNLPNYPQLDELLEDLYHASTFEEAKEKCKEALGFLVEKCINIPLVTPIDFLAYRKEVQGIIKPNKSVWTYNYHIILNRYNLLSAFKSDGSPIRVGVHFRIEDLNVLFDVFWPSKLDALRMIYDDLTYFPPDGSAYYIPWQSSWNIELWYDAETGENKTKFTFYLTNSSYWVKPVTGEILGRMTAYDFEFSAWYVQQYPDCRWWPGEDQIHHIKVIDELTVEVYMNTKGIYGFTELTFPILPKNTWTSFQQLAELKTVTFIEGSNVTTPGYIDLPYQDIGAPVAIEQISVDGNELIRYEDYDLVLERIRIYKDLPAGAVINVTYWARGNAEGTFPGNLPWQEILVGNGPFYITQLDLYDGRYIYFKANPYYSITPLNRDISISNVDVSAAQAKVGENITVYVVVENQGEIYESFNLAIYANETIISSKRVDLPPGNSSIVTFIRNTFGFSPGKYLIKAEAPILIGENDTTDNMFVDGWVTLTRPFVNIAVTQIVPWQNSINIGETLKVNVTVENEGEIPASFDVKLYANNSMINKLNVDNMPPQSSMVLQFSWVTSVWQPGSYQLSAEASILDWENETEGNFLADGIVTIVAQGTYIILSPSINEVTLGNSFSVAVIIYNVTDLYGYDVIMTFNTTLLTANKISEGPLLKSKGSTVIFTNITDNEIGYVRFAASLLGAERGADGNGTLFNIEFIASQQNTGTANLIFNYTALSNHYITPIPHYTINGQVDIVELSQKSCPVIKNGTTYEIVAISNSTIEEISFDEEGYMINMNFSGPSGTNGLCNITMPKQVLNGTIAILVNGLPVSYEKFENETHIILTFTFKHSEVQIAILTTVFGDLNGDRIVDIFDVVIVCVAYGSKPGDSNWNPIADIIKNNLVDIFDAVAVCVNYGKTWQP
jgi:hypothetical protein